MDYLTKYGAIKTKRQPSKNISTLSWSELL